MATWRRRDLERKHAARSGRIGRVLRPELVVAVLALIVAGVALWQAMAAQSRADLLAHDLSVANSRLRDGAYAPASTPAAPAASPGEAPLPPPPPMGAAAPSSASR
jgi:hypothetical protein